MVYTIVEVTHLVMVLSDGNKIRGGQSGVSCNKKEGNVTSYIGGGVVVTGKNWSKLSCLINDNRWWS